MLDYESNTAVDLVISGISDMGPEFKPGNSLCVYSKHEIKTNLKL